MKKTSLFLITVYLFILTVITSCGGGGGGGGAVSFQDSGAKYHNGGGNSGWGSGNQTGGGFGGGEIQSSNLLISQMAALNDISKVEIHLTINGVAQEVIVADETTTTDVLPKISVGDIVSGYAEIFLPDNMTRTAQLDETEIALSNTLKFKVPYYYTAYDLDGSTALVSQTLYYARSGIDLSAYTVDPNTGAPIAGWQCVQDGTIHSGSHVSGVRGDITLNAVEDTGAITIPNVALEITDSPSTATLNDSNVYLLSSLGSFKVKVNPQSGTFPSGVKYEWRIDVLSGGSVPDSILSTLENNQEITIDLTMLTSMGIGNIDDISINSSNPTPIVVRCTVKHDSLPSNEWKDASPKQIKICKAPTVTALATGASIDVNDPLPYPATITITGATGTPGTPVLNPASASSLLAIDNPTLVDANTGTYSIGVGIKSGAGGSGKVWFEDNTTVDIQIPDPSGVMASPTITITLVNKYTCQLKNSSGNSVGSLPTYNSGDQLTFSAATAIVGIDPSGRDIAAFKDTATNTVYKESEFPITFNSTNFSNRQIILQAIPEFEFLPSGGDGDGSTHTGTTADPYAIKKDLPSSNVNAYVTPSTVCGTIDITANPPFSTHGLLKVGTGTKIIQWESNPSPAALAAIPVGGITYEVTVTDTGSGAYKTIYVTAMKPPLIGTKPAPDTVGDIVFKDGSAMTSTEFNVLSTAEQNTKKADAVAVCFDATNKLGISLTEDSGSVWASTGTIGYDTLFATSETDGSGNWTVITGGDPVNTAGSNAATNYYPFYYCNNYTASGVGGWYLPSKGEFDSLASYLTTVNTTLSSLSGAAAAVSGTYWTSSQLSSGANQAFGFDASPGYTSGFLKNTIRKIRAIKKFD